MAGYGYQAPSYGYYKPPAAPRVQTRSLAAAASGRVSPSDPFGLDAGNGNVISPPHATPPAAAPAGNPQAAWRLANPTQAGGAAVSPSGHAVSTAPTPGAYDINTDPALQQVTALTGMNDEQARAQAMKQKRDELLAYGDPNLAQSLLGDSTLAQAAGQNPTSTLAGLGQQRDRNTHNLTEGLNQANLLYGGYRITQEQQAAQDFQNALAQAAGGVNSSLGGIDSNLAQTLGQNQSQRTQAMLDAYGRHSQDVGAGGGTDAPPPGTDPAAAGGYDPGIDPIVKALLLRGGGPNVRTY